MGRTQITGTEVSDNSIKGVDIDESTLGDELIPFDDSGFTADNIHDAIIEAAQPEEFPLVRDTLEAGNILNIANKYQLIIADKFYNYGTIKNYNRFKVV